MYLKAAESEGKEPVNCIAVEDSGSGVGSASNAGVGECCSLGLSLEALAQYEVSFHGDTLAKPRSIARHGSSIM